MSKAKEIAREMSPIHATFVTRRNAPSDGFLFFWGPDDTPETDWLGQLRRIGLTGIPASRLYPAQARLFLPARDGRYRIDNVSGRALQMGDAVRVLATAAFSQPKRDTRNKRKKAACPSVIAWSCVAKFALELIARGAFIPNLKTNGHNLYAVWQAAIENSADIGRVRRLAALMPICAHALYSIPHNRWDKSNKLGQKRRKLTMMWHPEALVRAFLDAAADAFVRSAKLPQDVIEQTEKARETLRGLERPKADAPLIEKLMAEYPQNFEAICEQNDHIGKPADKAPDAEASDDDLQKIGICGDDASMPDDDEKCIISDNPTISCGSAGDPADKSAGSGDRQNAADRFDSTPARSDCPAAAPERRENRDEDDVSALRRKARNWANLPDDPCSQIDLNTEYELQDINEIDIGGFLGNGEKSDFSQNAEENSINLKKLAVMPIGASKSETSAGDSAVDINESASFGIHRSHHALPSASYRIAAEKKRNGAEIAPQRSCGAGDTCDVAEIDDFEPIDDIEKIGDDGAAPVADPYSPTEDYLSKHPVTESTPSQLPLNASNLPDTGAEPPGEVSLGFPVKMTQEQLRKLMPMKEFVYAAPQELDTLPRWESRWIDALLDKKTRSRISYHLEDPMLVESISNWSAPIHDIDAAQDIDAHAGFWLEAPTDETDNMWFLRYMLVAVEDPSIAVRSGIIFSIGTEKLRIDHHSFDNPQERLLADLGKAAQYFEPIKKSLEQSKPEGVFLDVRQAWTFISEVSPLLCSSGFDVRLPPQLTDQGSRRLRARFRIRDANQNDAARCHFGLSEIAGFRWEAALGDEVVSAKEFREIVALKQPLVQWHGEWVLVDPVQLRDIELLIDQNEAQGVISRFDAINRALTGVADPNSPNSNIEVVVEGKIADILSRLTKEDITDMTLKAPDTFCGTLRPYQERGVAWLAYQSRLGLGCCLADDMGLGKTIQLICHILCMIKRNPADCRGILLICPMSVVGNWKREFLRFAPSVHVVVHHGNDRAQCDEDWAKNLEIPGTVVITTYGLIHRNADFLYAHRWSMIALDEAQAIKNASSKRSMLVRELQADFRVALTGTPIENRLSELWSILDFLNPGLLGTHARFQRLYGIPIERNNDEKAKERLRNVVAPFILRRVKSDPQIIRDLPEKMENKIFCSLTREQATIYQALVNSAMEKIERADGIARHGHVLALLTHLKQIVDHPALFQKSSPQTPDRSGKILRLADMLETIIENNERALIFTQFKEMGDLLVAILRDALDLETVPFLHGGLTSAQRDALVADFQSEDGAPVFILSLKAGGTGLNLTAASHVFHFDRWWNPAVEDQATDRAYRIGQNKNVQVHKFLTLGTLEEKIDAMLDEKKSLSDAIVDASGAWVSQLDTDALREIFTLSSEVMIDENA